MLAEQQKGDLKMAILEATKREKKSSLKVSLDDILIERMKRYCDWSGIDEIDSFIAQATEFVFKKDKDWAAFEKNGG